MWGCNRHALFLLNIHGLSHPDTTGQGHTERTPHARNSLNQDSLNRVEAKRVPSQTSGVKVTLWVSKSHFGCESALSLNASAPSQPLHPMRPPSLWSPGVQALVPKLWYPSWYPSCGTQVHRRKQQAMLQRGTRSPTRFPASCGAPRCASHTLTLETGGPSMTTGWRQ